MEGWRATKKRPTEKLALFTKPLEALHWLPQCTLKELGVTCTELDLNLMSCLWLLIQVNLEW